MGYALAYVGIDSFEIRNCINASIRKFIRDASIHEKGVGQANG